MSRASEWTAIANSIILLSAVGGAVVGFFVFYEDIRNTIATRAYHNSDSDSRQNNLVNTIDEKLAPIVASANAAESNSLPPRIKNLLVMRCKASDSWDASLQTMLDKQIARYEQLNGRPYRVGTCQAGVYVNALGIRAE